MWRDPLGDKMAAEEGPPALGAYTNDPDMVELMAHMGFDFVFIDQMFTSTDWQKCELLIRTAEAAGITPIIRLQSHPWAGYDPRLAVDLSRVMGIGAKYVRVSVSGIEEVRDCVGVSRDWHRKAMHIHPFNSFEEWESGIDEMARRTVLMPSAETVKSVTEYESIMAIPEIKVFTFGMTDASRVLGNSERPDWYSPQLWEMVDHAVELGRATGTLIGANTSYAYTMEEMHSRVMRLTQHGVRVILVQGAPFLFQLAVGKFLNELRDEIDSLVPAPPLAS